MDEGEGEDEENEKVWGAEVGTLRGVTEEADCEEKFRDVLPENGLGLHGVDERVHQVPHDGGPDVVGAKLGIPRGRKCGEEGHQSTPPQDGGIRMLRKSQVV